MHMLPKYRRVLYALLASNGVSLLFFIMRALESGSSRYWFFSWNLFLAWLPLLFSWLLVKYLKKARWITWQGIALTVLWLGFLPNSFYLISDLIHLHQSSEVSIMYDVVLFSSFIFNALVAGFMSMFLIHRELLKRIDSFRAYAVMDGVLLLCSFAIYLGRFLRWNTWDVLINPAGLLFDISSSVINPLSQPQGFVTTSTFFLLLASMYAVIWEIARALKSDK